MDVAAPPGLLAEALLALAGRRIERCLFTNSGTEAVEAAIKLGRAATKRPRVVSCDHAFHGLTMGALSRERRPEFTDGFGPLLPGFVRVPFGDLDALEGALQREDVAAFIVEPIQGKGVNLPPAGYLEGAQELCRRYGTLFCVDEVQTGLGRTGHCSRSSTGPRARPRPRREVALGRLRPGRRAAHVARLHEAVFDSMERAISHGSTFAPNELAMAAGLATLHELEEQRLVERAAPPRRAPARADAAARGRVRRRARRRGLGLMWAIEFASARAGAVAAVERHKGLFAQLVVVPLFTDHRILTQVAGHDMAVVSSCRRSSSPTTTSTSSLAPCARPSQRARRMPSSLTKFALSAAGAASATVRASGSRTTRPSAPSRLTRHR